jgi:hypothetical protein
LFLVDQQHGSLGSECFFSFKYVYFFQIIVLYFSISVLELPGIAKTILNMLFLKQFRKLYIPEIVTLPVLLCKFQLFFILVPDHNHNQLPVFIYLSFCWNFLFEFFIPLLDESRGGGGGGYIGILMSVRHTFGIRILIKVPLNQIFSNFHTLLCTIKYRLSLITVYFTFTVHELWPFFF